MWSPTHVQVLVKKARGLNIKGKSGTNDVFVTIGLGKEKYQTSVKEKATEDVEWCEQCELSIPQQGNTAEIVLTVLHRNFLGVDEFLGLVSIPLRDFDVYERPKTKFYSLKCKPGKNKTDYRGELEVRTSFTVKSTENKDIGSTSDLRSTKKENHKGSLSSLAKNKASNLGGSLLSLGTKEKKNLKKLAKSVTNRVEKVGEKAKRTLSKTNLNAKEEQHVDPTLPNKMSAKDLEGGGGGGDIYPGVTTKYVGGGGGSFRRMGSGKSKNRDPGVESDDEEDDMFKFDALSHRSSGSSLNVTTGGMGLVSKTSTPMSGSLEKIAEVVRDGVERPTDLLRRTFGTPVNARKEKELTPQSTPRSSRSMMIDAGIARKTSFTSSPNEPVLDEWEAKLLGKRSAVPYKANHDDAVSQHSQFSMDDKTNSLKRIGQQDHERQKAMAIPEETPSGRKKIIPVGSDFDSSPSPEPPRGSANTSADTSATSAAPSPFKKSPTKSLLGKDQSFDAEDDVDKKRKSIGLKLKTSYSFKDKQDDHHKPSTLTRRATGLNTSRDLRLSNESLGSKNHSRNHSDSGSNNSNNSSGVLPPSGQRVVLGRETTPTPGQGHNGESALSGSPRDSSHNQSNKEPSRIPKDVWARFEGASREDLIEMVVNLQHSVEKQAKVQSDLEDYIDSLLSKVISKAPDILQKNAEMNARSRVVLQNRTDRQTDLR